MLPTQQLNSEPPIRHESIQTIFGIGGPPFNDYARNNDYGGYSDNKIAANVRKAEPSLNRPYSDAKDQKRPVAMVTATRVQTLATKPAKITEITETNADPWHLMEQNETSRKNGLTGNEVKPGDEHWRPENAGILVPRGRNEAESSITDQLLYAATHTDATQKRHLANLIAKERLYRKVFCGITDDNHELVELTKCLENGDMSFIKFKSEDRELTLETLCKHIEQLVQLGYSLTYIFGYLSYLRRKYRAGYPKLRQQTSAFYRTLINLYEQARRGKKRISTDEVYTCEEKIYAEMRNICHEAFFSETITIVTTSDEATRNQVLFAYLFLFMYETGKRLSEIALISPEQLQTLATHEALVIRIPKSKKLGRIVLRGYDEEMRIEFKHFLMRAIDLFTRKQFEQCIPFDQYHKRRTLDRNFGRLYLAALRRLGKPRDQKPRGLSLHSLRRFRAGSMFQQGKDIEHIRECLDHSSTKVTNIYINKHLMRSYRTKPNETQPKSNWKSHWQNSWTITTSKKPNVSNTDTPHTSIKSSAVDLPKRQYENIITLYEDFDEKVIR
jgi:integrase